MWPPFRTAEGLRSWAFGSTPGFAAVVAALPIAVARDLTMGTMGIVIALIAAGGVMLAMYLAVTHYAPDGNVTPAWLAAVAVIGIICIVAGFVVVVSAQSERDADGSDLSTDSTTLDTSAPPTAAPTTAAPTMTVDPTTTATPTTAVDPTTTPPTTADPPTTTSPPPTTPLVLDPTIRIREEDCAESPCRLGEVVGVEVAVDARGREASGLVPIEIEVGSCARLVDGSVIEPDLVLSSSAGLDEGPRVVASVLFVTATTTCQIGVTAESSDDATTAATAVEVDFDSAFADGSAAAAAFRPLDDISDVRSLCYPGAVAEPADERRCWGWAFGFAGRGGSANTEVLLGPFDDAMAPITAELEGDAAIAIARPNDTVAAGLLEFILGPIEARGAQVLETNFSPTILIIDIAG